MLIDKDVTTLEAPFLLMHVANNKGVMGSGVALEIVRKWPVVKNDYSMRFTQDWENNVGKITLGQVIVTQVSSQPVTNKGGYVLSMIAQDGYGNDGKCYLKYDALKKCIEQARVISNKMGIPLYAPFKMGCGLAGGSWTLVASMLDGVYICKKPKE